MIGNPDGDKLDLPTPIRCGDIGAWMDSHYPQCPPGGGAECMMSD